ARRRSWRLSSSEGRTPEVERKNGGRLPARGSITLEEPSAAPARTTTMTTTRAGIVLRHLRGVVAAEQVSRLPDAELLTRFAVRREEVAFEALVKRHGPLVLGVCRRLLRDWHDAEDAFQATFLVLARKAATVGKTGAVAAWLHQVAYRVALKER